MKSFLLDKLNIHQVVFPFKYFLKYHIKQSKQYKISLRFDSKITSNESLIIMLKIILFFYQVICVFFSLNTNNGWLIYLDEKHRNRAVGSVFWESE